MLLGVISDTHKNKYYINKAIEKLENVDMIIHLGDNTQDIKEIEKIYKGSIIYVSGNCDFMDSESSEKILLLGGKKVFITHGDRYDVKNGLLKLRYRALELGVEIVLYGHTHVSKVDYEGGVFFINPGSTATPRNGVNTVATVDITGNTIIPSIVDI